MRNTCITHPANERLVIIRKWQVEFCEGNQCAAALLSYFEYWHSWKLNTDLYNRKSNDIAEFHREARLLSENVYQYHTLSEMSDGILNLYGEKKISEAIKFLESKSVISVHSNPNPKFHHDKTQYFRFYPNICNEWINSSYKSRWGENAVSMMPKRISDSVKRDDADGNNTAQHRQNAVYRTEINNKEINKLNDMECDLFDEEKSNCKLSKSERLSKNIVTALIAKGMPYDRLIGNQDVSLLESLVEQGATMATVLEAYAICLRATASKGKQFGLRYLAKAISDLLKKDKSITPTSSIQSVSEQVYENDFSGGLNWMGDLIK